jgi:hypothetical protein
VTSVLQTLNFFAAREGFSCSSLVTCGQVGCGFAALGSGSSDHRGLSEVSALKPPSFLLASFVDFGPLAREIS